MAMSEITANLFILKILIGILIGKNLRVPQFLQAFYNWTCWWYWNFFKLNKQRLSNTIALISFCKKLGGCYVKVTGGFNKMNQWKAHTCSRLKPLTKNPLERTAVYNYFRVAEFSNIGLCMFSLCSNKCFPLIRYISHSTHNFITICMFGQFVFALWWPL